MTKFTSRKTKAATNTVGKMDGRVCKRLAICNKSSSMVEDDVMFEIFLRLPLKEVFTYRLVSKQWLSILSNPIFISSWMTTNNFTPWTTLIYDSSLSVDKYLSTSELDDYSQFMSDHDGFSLKFLKSKVLRKNLYIISSSNGLVLCSTSKSFHTKYYVCNPLMKTSVLLPRPPTNKIVVAGLICETSVSSSTTSSYKVVRIPLFSKPKTSFRLEIFSSDLGKWSTFEVSCTQEVTMPKRLQSRSNIIEHNGVLYWIEGREDRIASFDITNNNGRNTRDSATNQCKLILLPEEFEEGEKLLAVLDGYVVCFHGKRNRLSSWALKDDINSEWICRFNDIPQINCNLNLMRPLAFDHVTQTIVLLEIRIYMVGPTPIISTYNLRTREKLHSVYAFKGDVNNFDFLKAFVFTPLPTPL